MKKIVNLILAGIIILTFSCKNEEKNKNETSILQELYDEYEEKDLKEENKVL